MSLPDCLTDFCEMGRNNRTRKFAEMKRMIKARDGRLNPDSKRRKKKQEVSKRSLKDGKIIERQLPKASSALFFQYNEQLGPPYHVIVDTNFINFTLKNRLDIKEGMKDCLMAKVTPYVTDCVVAELEKLGPKYRIALRIAQQLERLPCQHKGTYADDCIVNRVSAHKCYIAATCDRDLKRRIRKIPGVPIMYIADHKFAVERMPDVFGNPKRMGNMCRNFRF